MWAPLAVGPRPGGGSRPTQFRMKTVGPPRRQWSASWPQRVYHRTCESCVCTRVEGCEPGRESESGGPGGWAPGGSCRHSPGRARERAAHVTMASKSPCQWGQAAGGREPQGEGALTRTLTHTRTPARTHLSTHIRLCPNLPMHARTAHSHSHWHSSGHTPVRLLSRTHTRTASRGGREPRWRPRGLVTAITATPGLRCPVPGPAWQPATLAGPRPHSPLTGWDAGPERLRRMGAGAPRVITSAPDV